MFIVYFDYYRDNVVDMFPHLLLCVVLCQLIAKINYISKKVSKNTSFPPFSEISKINVPTKMAMLGVVSPIQIF